MRGAAQSLHEPRGADLARAGWVGELAQGFQLPAAAGARRRQVESIPGFRLVETVLLGCDVGMALLPAHPTTTSTTPQQA